MIILRVRSCFDLRFEIADGYFYFEYNLLPFTQFHPVPPLVPTKKATVQSLDLFDDGFGQKTLGTLTSQSKLVVLLFDHTTKKHIARMRQSFRSDSDEYIIAAGQQDY